MLSETEITFTHTDIQAGCVHKLGVQTPPLQQMASCRQQQSSVHEMESAHLVGGMERVKSALGPA